MTPLQSITKSVLQNISGSVLVKVDKSFIKKSSGGYCFDGTVLTPESLEETGEILKEVPINPIWGGKSGQGIFCPPESGQIVVVSFLEFNRAFPYYNGIYSDAYTPAEGIEGNFILTDGKGGIFKMSGDGLFSILNKGKSMKAILEEIVQGFIGLKTVGSPPAHALDPSQIATMTKLKTEISLLFKE